MLLYSARPEYKGKVSNYYGIPKMLIIMPECIVCDLSYGQLLLTSVCVSA